MVLFKREFDLPNVLLLWDALWSGHVAPQTLPTYVAVAIIRTMREKMIDKEIQFDGIVELCNNILGLTDLNEILLLAEAAVYAHNKVKRQRQKREREHIESIAMATDAAQEF